MRYPTDNFLTDWNTTAGYGYGDITSYGFHEGDDLNLNGGGNIDLGQPLYAVSDGEITSVHTHTTSPTFGNHIHLKFSIDGKDYWAHYAHCQDIYVTEGQKVKKGDKVATVGNSGTVYAHCHFAIKNQPTGIDGIAKTKEDLKKWESPIAFVKAHLNEEQMANITQKELDEIRIARDENYNKYQDQIKITEDIAKQLREAQEYNNTLLKQLEKINDQDTDVTSQLIMCQKASVTLQNAISAVNRELGVSDASPVSDTVKSLQELKKSKIEIIKEKRPTGFIQKLIFLFT